MQTPSEITLLNFLYPRRIVDFGSVCRTQIVVIKGSERKRGEPADGRAALCTRLITYREFVTSFCTSAGKHFSAVFCCHTCPKTVCISSFAFMWLIRSFHFFSIVKQIVIQNTKNRLDIQD